MRLRQPASIRCGKCKQTHESVLAVKTCYERGGAILAQCSWCSYDSVVVHTVDDQVSCWADQAAEAAAEQEVEYRTERWYEERGGDTESAQEVRERAMEEWAWQ